MKLSAGAVRLSLVMGFAAMIIFRSAPGLAVASPCPNEALRLGLSSSLPDCRAYELVSPPSADGRQLAAISTFGFENPLGLFPTELAASQGNNVVYMTYSSALQEPGEAIGIFDLYQAHRTAGGWVTGRRLTPNGQQSIYAIPGGVAADQRFGLVDVLTPSGSTPEGAGTLAFEGTSTYLSKPDGAFESLGRGDLGIEPYAQGRFISTDGQHVIFSTGHDIAGQSAYCKGGCEVLPLEENAPPKGTGAVYDREADGPTKVVSLLPGNETPAAGHQAFYQGNSKDGAVVAFEVDGILYVRYHNEKTEEVTGGEPTYAGLSDDGQYLFYVAGGNIHRFDTISEEDVPMNASGDAEVVNVSADGSHVYFISPSQLDGSEGEAGKPNLYVWAGVAPNYVATVAESDLERTSGHLPEPFPALTRWTSSAVSQYKDQHLLRGPGADSSRTTPDGHVLVFESRARLTSFESSEHTEIYRYDDGDESLICVSCNLRLGDASGDAHLQTLTHVLPPIVIHNVSDDGSRVFFETPEALVAADEDGVNDIYEWEAGAPLGEQDQLISSGHSVEYPLVEGLENEQIGMVPLPPNLILSVTPDGSNAVFLSQDALVPGAAVGGTPAIYDARVDGGFPAPTAPRVCLEEECRPPPSSAPPLDANPPSETLLGAGNVRPRHRHKRSCHRHRSGKHRHPCGKPKPRKRPARASAGGSNPAQQPQPSVAEAPADNPQGQISAVAAPSGASAAAATSASGGPFDEFGIASLKAALTTTAAGMHPDFTTTLVLNHFVDNEGKPQAKARLENAVVTLPPGLIGNPNATPRCETGAFFAFANCPIDSQVGTARVAVVNQGVGTEPIYNLAPAHPDREIARFGFPATFYPVFIDVRVRTAGDYGVTATVEDSPGLGSLVEAQTTFWGNPADPSHDEERLTALEALKCLSGTACEAPGGKRASGIEDPQPFFSNPSACQEGQVSFAVTSYQLPGQTFEKSAALPAITNCRGLPFAPNFEAEPTSRRAGAPTGLKTALKLPQAEDPSSPSTATMREARVSLPEGMEIAAGAADGIAACSDEQVGFHEEVNAACPDASKLGTATIESSDLPAPLHGALYQRTPMPGRQFGLWLVTDELGLHVKLPGEIQPDPSTGRLTAVFKDLPQVPVGEIDLDVWGGPRAPLKNPDTCGNYATSYTFAPHSEDPAVSGESTMTIDEGCDQPFSPKLHAGVNTPTAGAFSPFTFDLTREDGEQALRGFELTLPQGELAKLAGVPLCPDAAAASGACPASSRIGSLTASTGPGPNPLWIPQPGKPQPAIYLGGPYQGAPYSAVSEVPAQAGPFDLGVITVRSGIYVDPETARATVKADPLPQFIEGVGIVYRRLHAVVDRPGFTLNPTNCGELAVSSTAASTQGAVAHPTARFEVDGCRALKFKPRLALKLRGGTKRAAYPAFSATLRARPGDANVGRVSVALPHSEFLAQEHIGTICTRVQFAADKCPKRSVYGRAKAFTPLLDQPLEGPVYLRSSNHPLPDLVVALRGQIEFDLDGRIDSIRGGIRTTFSAVPDAPVTKFVLQMKGGKKGLLTNSQDICRGPHRATVAMRAQNGRALHFRPRLRALSCRK